MSNLMDLVERVGATELKAIVGFFYVEGWRHTDKASLIEKYGFSVDGAEKLCALLYIYAIAQDIAPFNKQAQ